MMFKLTTVVVLAAALMTGAQGAAVDADTTLEARQAELHPLCPRNTDTCGFWILEPQNGRPAACATIGEVARLGNGTNWWNYKYTVDAAGHPVKVTECKQGCNLANCGYAKTICNEERGN